jgi:hypothetical protein
VAHSRFGVLQGCQQTRKRLILVGFRDSRTVFGFSDTDGDDGDDLPAVELPGWDAETALAALGIDRLAFHPLSSVVVREAPGTW